MIKKHSKNDATMSMCIRCHMWTSAHIQSHSKHSVLYFPCLAHSINNSYCDSNTCNAVCCLWQLYER